MPLYEYECSSCGHRIEVIQRVGAPPIGSCSECGSDMRRLVSAPAFQFKGTGWYVTDYAGKGAASGGESKTNSEKSGETKTEAKSSGKKED